MGHPSGCPFSFMEGITLDKVLQQGISADQMITWLIIAFLVGYFIYKEWPEFKRRVSGSAVKEVTDKTTNERLSAIEADIKEIKEKLANDYARLNNVDSWKSKMDRAIAESLEEREILMQAMLGVLGGLQELGANGQTEEAMEQIQTYINKQAHKRGDQ